MKEQDRLFILKEIDEQLEEIESLEDMHKTLEELSKDLKVVKYENLKRSISDIERKLEQTNVQKQDPKNFRKSTKDLIIENKFRSADVLDQNICNHDIWAFDGKYSSVKLNKEQTGKTVWTTYESKNPKRVYVCLDCGKHVIEGSDSSFEEDHIVIKSPDKSVEEIRNLYFKTLCSHDAEDSIKQMVRRFKK